MEEIHNNIGSAILNQLNSITQTTQTTKTTKDPISTILNDKYSANSLKTFVSDSANLSSAAIDNFSSVRGESIISGIDLIQTTCDALDEMQSNLAAFRQILDDSANYGDEYGVLTWLDEKSNAVIDKLLDIYNNTEYNGVKVFSGIQDYTSSAMLDNYQNFVFSLGTPSDTTAQLIVDTKINLEGLEGIRNLSLDDENYDKKIDEIIAEINKKREELYSKQEALNNIAQSLYEEDTDDTKNTESSSDIQAQIINNATSTLNSVTQGLSAENILQFFNK